MPWYYAGPEAKPVGPVSLEELQSRRAGGVILPETYIIEDTGRPEAPPVWKRYQEVFPAKPTLPPLPPASPVLPPTYHAPPPPPLAQPHPLFPSAAPVPGQSPVFKSPAGPDPYYNTRRTNAWCAWGFGMAIAGLFLIFCGVGLFLAVPALLMCLVGLIQVNHHPEQSGRGLAISGLLLSILALFLFFVVLIVYVVPKIKAHEMTTTEQTSNDSD